MIYDAIVIGAGGLGSAAVFHLATRGARVLALEQFEVPHTRGSSHGHTRIIRLAYWEHSAYVPLLQRAFALWRDLEGVAGESLLVTTGSIDAGPRGSRPIAGALDACRQFDLRHEQLDSGTLGRRFPGYRLPDSLVSVFQPDGGFLRPERCVSAHVNAARDRGAVVRTNERVVSWDVASDSVVVRTKAATYSARRLVVTAGPWAGGVVQTLQPLLSVERQVVMWTTPPRPERFTPDGFPVFYLHDDEGSFYGVPMVDGRGFKIGKYHHRRQIVDPDTVDRVCSADDEAVLRGAIRRYFPDADGPAAALETCLFTNTADEHFVIDVLPDVPAVTIAAGFSGHGFKFCSVVGEILADLALDGGTRHDISLFGLDRLRRVSPRS